MISVIICSVNPELLSQLSNNIKNTIGTPYELIATDNRGSAKGICQVYNEAATKARYDILCFIHEDIIIKTNDWGKKLTELFKDPKLGLVGVAGSSYRPLTPTNWGGFGGKTTHKNIIQTFKKSDKPDHHYYINPKDEKLSNVTCVDGVWLATTKKVTSEIKFDENTFKDFHLYDMDFCMSVIQKYRVAVTYEILINHLSEGSYDRGWMDDNLKFHAKWNAYLPINIEGLSMGDIIFGEKVSFKHFIDELIYFKYPISTAFKVLSSNNRFLKLNPKLFFKLQFHIIKKYITGIKPKAETLLQSLLIIECLHVYQSFIKPVML
jgi:hypothetical protein